MTSHSLIQQPDFAYNSGPDNFNVIFERNALYRFQFKECEMRIFFSIIHIKTLAQTFRFACCFVTLRNFENATNQLANNNNNNNVCVCEGGGSVSTPLWTFISETLSLKLPSSSTYFTDTSCLPTGADRPILWQNRIFYSLFSVGFSCSRPHCLCLWFLESPGLTSITFLTL